MSQCIHATAALLYPFSWAHTYATPPPPASLRFLGLFWSSGLRGRCEIPHTSSRLWSGSQAMQAVGTILAISFCLFQLPSISQKDLIHPSGPSVVAS